MLCACSGVQFKFEEHPKSPESLATRDFSDSCLSSRTGDWESKYEDIQVDEVESTLKEALSLNYEEARALLGRLEYQRGNFDAALQVFQGIDVKVLAPRMTKAIAERLKLRKPRSKADSLPSGLMSIHSVSLLLEAILLKARSLMELGRFREAAKECKIIVDIIDSALPIGMPEFIEEDCKLQEILHRALELLPKLWTSAGFLDEAIIAYRRALIKPWNLELERLANVQKELASMLLYGGVESSLSLPLHIWGPISSTAPKNNTEEAIVLLLILVRKAAIREIKWDQEIMDHLTYALSITGQFELLAEHVEQILPGIYDRAERWHFLALCYSAAKQQDTALNLLRKICGCSEGNLKPHFAALLLGAKLCSENSKHARDGIYFACKLIDSINHQNKDSVCQARKFLGICYGGAARISLSDSDRVLFHKEALENLNLAANGCDDPEIRFNLGLEHAVQRNLDLAFDNLMLYVEKIGGSGKGLKLLALIVSAQQRLENAETIVDFALDETEAMDHLELLRLKGVLQTARKQPKQAIETYRIMLAHIQTQREIQLQSDHSEQSNNYHAKESELRKLEAAAWEDLANVYLKLGSWGDAEICLDKAKAIEYYSARSWHKTGTLLEAKEMYREALESFSRSLSVDPDYVPSIVSTAEVLIKLGDQSLPIARSLLMNAIRLEPTSHDAWFNLGLISKKEGLIQQAADFFQAAHELKSSAPVQSFV